MTICRPLQNIWLPALAGAIDHVQLLDSTDTPIGASVAASFTQKGLALVNLTTVTLPILPDAQNLALQQGTDVLFSIYWIGGVAVPGQLVFLLGAS